MALDQIKHESTQFTYDLNGVWKGAFKVGNIQYDTLSVPRAGVIVAEGLPEIPKEGIFISFEYPAACCGDENFLPLTIGTMKTSSR